jgi:ferredoxin-type protein NapF
MDGMDCNVFAWRSHGFDRGQQSSARPEPDGAPLIDPNRRLFLRGSRPPAGGADTPPRPPWASRPDADFTARCTRCGDCLQACPRGVLKAGDGGFPEITFERQGCSLCGDCSRVCTTGAIGAISASAFHRRVQVADLCLAQHGVECRVCADACETRAIRFVPALGGIAKLTLELSACTGCGDCIAPCPVAALSLA